MKQEVQTSLLIEAALNESKRVFVPKISKRSMKMVEINRNDLESMKPNAYGILEPETEAEGIVDLVIVPGLAFDLQRNRLGHGRGYYDRWIERQSIRPCLMGICLKEQIMDNVPTSDTDVKMDHIIIGNGSEIC